MKEQQKINCSRCNRPISVMSWYCCDPEKHYCMKCSSEKCRLCHLLRTNVICHIGRVTENEKIKVQKFLKRKDAELAIDLKMEEKCKQFYCHSCLIVFYQNNYQMVESLKKQFGQAPLIDVELQCGCEVDKKKIIEYIKKYCYYCSNKILTARVLQMKNQCLIMVTCYLQSQRQSKRKQVDRQKQTKIKNIISLVYECDSCKKVIQGQIMKIDQLFLCWYCYQSAQYAQKLYYPKPNINKDQKIQIQKDMIKLEKKAQLKCQLCNKDVSELIGVNRICQKCISDIQGDNDIQINSPLQYQLVKKQPLNKQQKQQQQQKQKLNQKQKQKDKSKILKQQPKLPEPQKKIVQQQKNTISNLKEVEKMKPDQIQKKYSQIPDAQDKDKPRQSPLLSLSSIDQFEGVEMFKLKCNIPKYKMIECIKCKAFYAQQQSFSSYYRDVSNESTLRVAQSEQQISKYKDKDQIKIYCKACYLSVKKQIKRKQQLKRYSLRQSYSVPKKQKAQVKKQVGYSNGFGKSLFQNNTYSKFYSKKLENKVQNNKGLNYGLQSINKKQQEKEGLVTCKQCNKKVPISQLSARQKLCIMCQDGRKLKQSKLKQGQLQKYKCLYCKNIYFLSSKSEEVRSNRCPKCHFTLFKA